MPENAVDPTAESRGRRRPGLASGMALIVAATAVLWAGPPRLSDAPGPPSDDSIGIAALNTDGGWNWQDGRPAFSRQTPPILRPDHAGNVQFEIVYAGSVELLRVFYFVGTGYVYDEFPRVETGTIGGHTVSIFRPSWAMGEFLLRFGLTIDFDDGGGAAINIAASTVPLAANGFPTISDVLVVRGMSVTVGNVPVVQIDATEQYSSHVVNLVVPALANSLDPIGAPMLFYSYFGDDYEQLSFVFREYPFVVKTSGASHQIAKNQISGINIPLWTRSGEYGSAGRLEGLDLYLNGIDNDVSNHELSHQWGHYFDWQPIIGIQGWGIHTPLWGHYESPLTVGSLISSNLQLRPLGGVEWEVAQAPAPTQIPPLLAYAMGRLEASAVPPVDIFENQNRPGVRPGDRVSGATRRATIDQIVAHHGPRVGPTVTTVRRATVLLSRDALATPAEMAYWTLMVQRLEDPYQTGMISEGGIGSFRAISGVTLHTRVIPPRVDRSSPVTRRSSPTCSIRATWPGSCSTRLRDSTCRTSVSFACRASSSILCSPERRVSSSSTAAARPTCLRPSSRMAASASSVRRRWASAAFSSACSSPLTVPPGKSQGCATCGCSEDREFLRRPSH